MMENVFVSPADVEMVKRIPPREVLLQQILFVLESPVANLVGVLSETLRTFLAVLDAIIQQKQGGELPPVSEVSEEPVVAN
jgi:ribosomal protein L10